VFVLWLLLSNTAIGQNTKTQLASEKKQIEEEIAEQKKLLEATKKNKTASLRDIQLITNQIKKQEQLIEVINDEISSLNHDIEENTKELNALKNKLDVLIDEYKKAVYVAYKYRNVINKTGFVLSSESFTQAARRMNYLQEYSHLLNQQLSTILRTQDEIKKKNTILYQNKAEKTQLFQDKNKEKQNLSKQQQEKNIIVANLKKKESQINNEIVQRVKRQKQIDDAIKKIIAEEIAAREKRVTKTANKETTSTTAPKTNAIGLTPEEANLASNFESNKGKLPWPVEKGSIVANFGTYSHPEVSSVKITNNGINILTEKNAPVRVVFNGVVSCVFEVDGSKVVMIRHGNYITVYSNLSTVNVKQDSKVTTKQVIGHVKGTASETHSELHFEIWKDKNMLNPSLWIMR
jgi:septal ring factor EnvC (AmiA/AmiB activator)